MERNDPYNLQRFVDAQAPLFEQVLRELGGGEKTSHWMWFIFPQIRGLGRSYIAEQFAISSLTEAEAYIRHAILGPRLRECTRLVNAVEGRSAREIFDSPDDLKFRSCVTLFVRATPDNAVFEQALQKYFEGQPDPRTLEFLR
jgi:uncharacterized protein (DUF1810 family)